MASSDEMTRGAIVGGGWCGQRQRRAETADGAWRQLLSATSYAEVEYAS
jgi:hypothetical protein